MRRREHAKSEFRRRNIFELYIEEVVEACNRLKGGKLPKEKLKDQLQKIAMKRTGGQKTNELLGNDGSGPEGLPHSIIVTPEGTEGEAPVLSVDGRNDVGPPEEAEGQEEEPALPTLAKKNADSTMKGKAVKVKQHSRAKRRGQEQTVLPFVEKTRTSANGGRNREKHGAKKTKK